MKEKQDTNIFVPEDLLKSSIQIVPFKLIIK